MTKKITIHDLFPSRYIKSSDLGNSDMVLTIDRVEIEDLGFGVQEETKPVLYFKEIDKGLVLNKTNANTIADLYGPVFADWSGKRIALFATEVSFQGKQTLGIRVRMRPPADSDNPSSDESPPSTSNWVD